MTCQKLSIASKKKKNFFSVTITPAFCSNPKTDLTWLRCSSELLKKWRHFRCKPKNSASRLGPELHPSLTETLLGYFSVIKACKYTDKDRFAWRMPSGLCRFRHAWSVKSHSQHSKPRIRLLIWYCRYIRPFAVWERYSVLWPHLVRHHRRKNVNWHFLARGRLVAPVVSLWALQHFLSTFCWSCLSSIVFDLVWSGRDMSGLGRLHWKLNRVHRRRDSPLNHISNRRLSRHFSSNCCR